MSTTPRLYELAGADPELRFSPYCWRIRVALAHKQLDVQTLAWRFTDKEAIAASGQGKVPVLIDGEACVHDSWAIAEYLESRHADRPSLFGGEHGLALARFVRPWVDTALHPALARLILPDIHAVLHERDRDYFRRTREAAFGCTLESLAEPAQREASLKALDRTLRMLRAPLSAQPFLAGRAPNHADHIVFGAFQWARVIRPLDFLGQDDPVHGWLERMLDAYGGLGRSARLAYR